MRKLKYNPSRIALNHIYISYVLSILEYSSLVWNGCTQYETNSLEKLQHETARIVGLTRSVSWKTYTKSAVGFHFPKGVSNKK